VIIDGVDNREGIVSVKAHLLLIVLAFVICPSAFAPTSYVDKDKTAVPSDDTSWGTVCRTVHEGIDNGGRAMQ